MSKSSMDSWGKEPGQNPDYLRNCTPKKLRNINPKQIGPIGDPPHISFWKSGFKKSKHHLFQMVPNLAFVGKKGEIIGPGPGQKEIQIPQKTCQIRGWHGFSFLCILLVPNALPKREQSLWLPPQNVLRQGWLGHYYKSFPDNWNQVFLR